MSEAHLNKLVTIDGNRRKPEEYILFLSIFRVNIFWNYTFVFIQFIHITLFHLESTYYFHSRYREKGPSHFFQRVLCAWFLSIYRIYHVLA